MGCINWRDGISSVARNRYRSCSADHNSRRSTDIFRYHGYCRHFVHIHSESNRRSRRERGEHWQHGISKSHSTSQRCGQRWNKHSKRYSDMGSIIWRNWISSMARNRYRSCSADRNSRRSADIFRYDCGCWNFVHLFSEGGRSSGRERSKCDRYRLSKSHCATQRRCNRWNTDHWRDSDMGCIN